MAVRTRGGEASRVVSSVLIERRQVAAGADAGRSDQPMLSVATPLAACEARIEHQPRRLPIVAIAGASYTAGIGPGHPELSWAVALAWQLRWNAVVYGVPGTGYVTGGASGRGPVSKMLSAERLRGLGPALVIVQAGHNDLGAPVALEDRQVRATVALIRAAVPRARIGLLTTFAVSPAGSPALRRLDHAIITAGTAAAPGAIIMDPLAGPWVFPRAGDGLHPTGDGDTWIARTVAGVLRANGVRPAPANSGSPVVCDVSVGAGKPTSAPA